MKSVLHGTAARLAGAAICFVHCVAARAAGPAPSFQAAKVFPSEKPTSAAVADLNGDGRPDIVLATGNISVLLATASGGFATAVDYKTAGTYLIPRNHEILAVRDVSGDGIPDILLTNNASPTVTIWFGVGNGTFQTGVNFAAGNTPMAVAVGDVNGDGWPDIVTADQGYSTVSVILGLGHGAFGAPAVYPTGSDPCSVAIGDVTGDAKPDIVTVSAAGDNASVLPGDGHGVFVAPTLYPVGKGPISVKIADFNGDGQNDVLALNETDATVSLLLNGGAGTLQPKFDIAVGADPQILAVADLNHDGKPDAVIDNYTDNTFSALIGKGDGTFQPRKDFLAPQQTTGMAVGDVDADGILDVVAGSSLGGLFWVVSGKGDGTFADAILAGPPGPGSYGVYVAYADFNGDGKPDIVAKTPTSSTPISVLMGNGDGTFTTSPPYLFGTQLAEVVATADLNGDGKADIVVASYGSATSGSYSVLLGKGDGTFQPQMDTRLNAPLSHLAVADFNHDGIPDIVTASSESVEVAPGDVQDVSDVDVSLGNGDGTFRLAYAYNADAGSMVVADINGDGNLDIKLDCIYESSHGPGTVYYVNLLGHGDGTFDATSPVYGSENPASVAMADVNGDGVLDSITGGTVLISNGDGTFQPPVVYGASGGYNTTVVDVNGDGAPDIVLGVYGPRPVAILLNTLPAARFVPTLSDAARALQEAAGLLAALPLDVGRYDLTFDGRLAVADAVRIIRRALGM